MRIAIISSILAFGIMVIGLFFLGNPLANQAAGFVAILVTQLVVLMRQEGVGVEGIRKIVREALIEFGLISKDDIPE